MNIEDGYIQFIINPKSGSHSATGVVLGLRDYLQFRKFDIRVHQTKSLEHAKQLAVEAAGDERCKLVIAAGGDGTIRDVASSLINSETPLMPLPGGTENLLASELGYDEKLTTAIKAFEEFYIKPLDLCRANDTYFTSIAGFGFDGQIIHHLAQNRSGNIDHMDYFWPIWRTVWTYKFPPLNVEIDGEKVFSGRGLVFIGNISRYALSLHILKNADYSDGLLDVCIYKISNHFTLGKSSLMTIFKQHIRTGSVIYRQARNIKVSSENNIYCQLDGDPGPSLPIDISVIPQAVKLVIPKDKSPAGLRTRFVRLFQ
jgi:diacylglycerol kinase (ATP)